MSSQSSIEVAGPPHDHGFTLIELLIAIVLSSVIAGVVLAALLTSLNASSATTALVSDSTDAGLISSYLFRDAQSAGAVDPAAAAIDPLLGVSSSNTTAGWSGCTQANPLVARFSWVDRLTTPVTVVATYALDAQHQLIRRLCRSGTTTDLTIGRNVASATLTCLPDATCVAPSTSVSLLVTGSNVRAPFVYTLTADLRLDTQAPPSSSNSAAVPLLAIGPGSVTTGCSTVTLSGTGAINVLGSALVNSKCGATAISGDRTRLQPSGATSTQSDVTDPMAGRLPPTGACSGASNPVVGSSAGPTASTVYPLPVSITGAVVFSPGRHVFCAGLTLGAGSQVSGAGVLLYVAGGTLSVDRLAIVDLSPSTSGPYVGLLAWVTTPQTISLRAGPRTSNLRGVVYAPTSIVNVASENAVSVGGLIVDRLTVTGAGRVRVGLPIPVISILPASLAPGEVGVSYSAGLISSGGTAPSTWSATGLPAGLTLSSTTGVISGSPTAAGTFQVVATTFDATAAAASIEYTLTIAPALSISSPATLPNAIVGSTYPATTVVATGGTAPFVWSATGLPTGLRIDAATGVISGTPTQEGVFAPIVTVADASGGSGTRAFTVTIASPLSITATVPAAAGQVGTAFTATTTATVGGFAPYSWAATNLPPGLTIDTATGIIAGTPTTSGTFAVTVVVTDSTGVTASTVATVTIAPLVAVPPGCPTAPIGWRGEYFANMTLTGTAKLCRDDAAINFDWGSGAPATGLPTDNFSVRWTRTQAFAAGSYTFSIGSDDGSRLYIDGVVVFDRWVDQGYPSTVPTVLVKLTEGSHTIVLEYYERGGAARATLTWVAGTGLPASCLVTPKGWLGEYYSNVSLTGSPVICRDDEEINFEWEYGIPITGLPSDAFSVRWTRVRTFSAGTYTFTLGTDDGGRLYIDGLLVIDRWVDQAYPSPEPTTVQKLTAGKHTIVVEYYERGGFARAMLKWS